MRKLLNKLRNDQRGASAIEYGLIVAVVAMAMLGALTTINSRTGSLWGNIADKIPTRS